MLLGPRRISATKHDIYQGDKPAQQDVKEEVHEDVFAWDDICNARPRVGLELVRVAGLTETLASPWPSPRAPASHKEPLEVAVARCILLRHLVVPHQVVAHYEAVRPKPRGVP